MKSKYNLVILGGGISALGVALAAVEKHKSVCIIDEREIGAATSNNSLRIIHGGLRYLQKLDFPRIFQSVGDQTYCLKKWPTLITPLNCVAPLTGRGLKRVPLAYLATLLYALVLRSLGSKLDSPRILNSNSLKELSFLSPLAKDGLLFWQDAVLSDNLRLVKLICDELRQQHVTILENQKVFDIRQHEDGVVILDSDGLDNILSDFVVNATGPKVNQFQKAFDCQWTLAFNVIFERKICSDHAFACDGSGGRYYFYVPRGSFTALGTAYYPCETPLADPLPSTEQIHKFIESAAEVLPELNFKASSIHSVESGILPCKGFDKSQNPIFLGKSLFRRNGRVLDILSTKYTTFISQGREIVNSIWGK